MCYYTFLKCYYERRQLIFKPAAFHFVNYHCMRTHSALTKFCIQLPRKRKSRSECRIAHGRYSYNDDEKRNRRETSRSTNTCNLIRESRCTADKTKEKRFETGKRKHLKKKRYLSNIRICIKVTKQSFKILCEISKDRY